MTALLLFLPPVHAISLDTTTKGIVYLALMVIIVWGVFRSKKYVKLIQDFIKDPYKKKKDEEDKEDQEIADELRQL